MTSVVDCPDSSPGELRFHLFGIPVHVQSWFWLLVIITAANRETGEAMIWIAVCFVSILLHELAHVFAFRAFGVRAEAVLYAWGGLAIPDRDVRNNAQRVIVSLAGPFAGFCLAALVLALVRGAHGAILFDRYLFVIPNVHAFLVPHPHDFAAYRGLRYWNVLINDLLYVNIFWGLVNLLPVYPLDGGQASRAVFEEHNPVRGRRRSLILSVIAGVAVAILGIFAKSTYLIWLFGILAAASAQLLESERRVVDRRYRSPRDSARESD